MKANITFAEIVEQLYNVFSDDRRAASYMSDRGEMYDMFSGWAGPMSPANRPAFVNTFGQDVTDRAEAEARARVDEYRGAVAASAYHRHELEADTFAAYGDPEKSQILARLEEIRAAILAENVSYEETAYLQEHAEYIDPADTQLLEWAGVPEADGVAYGEPEKSPVPDHLADIYQRAKAKIAEAVALFHCGDWFTAYGVDADRVADAVGIIITTTRDGFRKASFPFAALDTYLPRMVRQGMKVCICEAPRQAEPSRQEKVAQEV